MKTSFLESKGRIDEYSLKKLEVGRWTSIRDSYLEIGKQIRAESVSKQMIKMKTKKFMTRTT